MIALSFKNRFKALLKKNKKNMSVHSSYIKSAHAQDFDTKRHVDNSEGCNFVKIVSTKLGSKWNKVDTKSPILSAVPKIILVTVSATIFDQEMLFLSIQRLKNNCTLKYLTVPTVLFKTKRTAGLQQQLLLYWYYMGQTMLIWNWMIWKLWFEIKTPDFQFWFKLFDF